MAAVVVILGSMVGFVAGLVGWLALDLSLLSALAVWIGSGPAAAALVALAGLTGARSATAAEGTMAEV